MPYIGNQHNVGDHVNNFKVLDDISSHTATFNGSATSVVSAADDTIRIPQHRFIQGQRVTYTNGGGGNIGGLTTGTAYFVSFDSANTIKLATTLANANSNTVINISAVGSGTSHTLNAAFDGVNTKFKMTYGSGKSARLNNATQLNVAINNVIQRPNQSALSFTEGFAIEDNHKIVFKVAPTVNDIFWGSIIANTIENFDLRDNEVDNFTGDGSTTEFTLSTIPANNESVIVSINGVVQHPSDKNNSRAYTLIDSIIQFTAAPALNDEIQVRHIGFAGATTNDVSGFYGRTGNVALISTDNISVGDISTSRNINATGIITASSFRGDGSQLTGIDATALKDTSGNIKIQAQASGAVHTGISTFQDIDVDGHTNLDNLSVAGVSTFTGDATFSGNVSIGGTLTYEDVTNIDSVGFITARSSIYVADSIIHQGDTDTKIDFATNQIKLTANNRLRIDLSANNYNYFWGSNLSEASSTYPKPSGATFVHRFRDTSGDDTIIHFHNTNVKNTVFEWNAYGNTSAAGNLIFRDLNTGKTEYARFTGTGSFNIAKDLDVDGHTNLDNVSIAGFTTASEGIFIPDDKKLEFGNASGSGDIRIYSNSSNNNTYLESYSGSFTLENKTNNTLYINSHFLDIRAQNYGDRYIYASVNSSVNLYYNNVLKLSTASSGINVVGTTTTGQLAVTGVSTFSGDVDLNANIYARNLVLDGNNGIKYIDADLANSNSITFRGYVGSSYQNMADFTRGGSCGLNFSGNRKLETSNTGVTVTGTVVATGADINGDLDVDGHTNLDNVSIAGVATATSFSGNGSNLTALNIVTDTSPQLGADLDVNDFDIKNGNQIYEIVSNARHNFKSAGNTIMNINGNGVDFQHGNNTHADGVESRFGTGNDMKLYHNGSNSFIQHSGTGDLYIDTQNNSSDIYIRSRDNLHLRTNNGAQESVACVGNGGVILYTAGNQKFTTDHDGATITGRLAFTSAPAKAITLADNKRIYFGDGDDMWIGSNGSNGEISGSLYLYNHLYLYDNVRLRIGNGQDIDIYHDTSSNRINSSNAPLAIQSVTQHDIAITHAGADMIRCKPDAEVELSYSGSMKLETRTDGVYVSGDLTATGFVDSASDIKLKRNIKTIDNALDKVLQLRGAEYNRIDKDNQHEIGVIAQEVEKIIPEVVHGEDTKTVSYGNMVAVLIEAIKEQNEVINKMKKEIEDLKE